MRAMKLRGARVLVTGSTSGIGEAIAEQLMLEGADTVVTGRDQTRGARVASRLARMGPGRSTFVPADLSSAHGPATLVDHAERFLGGVDVLVNNAGFWVFGPSHEVGAQTLNELWNVNVRAVFLLSAMLMERMGERGGGAVVNITSATAYRGYPRLAAYGASKAAVNQLTKSWASEFGPRGVRVNAVSPAQIPTEGIPAPHDVIAEFTKSYGLGHPGSTKDVAEAVAFLASEEASFVSGATLHLDGGMLQTLRHREMPAP